MEKGPTVCIEGVVYMRLSRHLLIQNPLKNLIPSRNLESMDSTASYLLFKQLLIFPLNSDIIPIILQ